MKRKKTKQDADAKAVRAAAIVMKALMNMMEESPSAPEQPSEANNVPPNQSEE